MDTQRIKDLLTSLGFEQRFNTDQTAICVLALFDSPKIGIRIHDIIQFARKNGVNYAENTRESIRKGSMKRLVNYGLAIVNPDDPKRPVNSGNTNYILDQEFIRIIGAQESEISDLIESWKGKHKIILEQQKLRETDHLISVRLTKNKSIQLSPGDHNQLEADIVNVFMRIFVKDFVVIYLSDAKFKMKYLDEPILRTLGLDLDEHDKLPDLICWSKNLNSLIVVEAVTSVGPIEESRKIEIMDILNKRNKIKTKVLFLTAFPSRQVFAKFSRILATNTDVWISSEPQGLIRFIKDGRSHYIHL